jgi:hypothetical protein
MAKNRYFSNPKSGVSAISPDGETGILTRRSQGGEPQPIKNLTTDFADGTDQKCRVPHPWNP